MEIVRLKQNISYCFAYRIELLVCEMGLIFLFHSEDIKKSDIAHDLFCLLSFIFFVIKINIKERW